jgi:exodeoxyribonuclease VII large subunit
MPCIVAPRLYHAQHRLSLRCQATTHAVATAHTEIQRFLLPEAKTTAKDGPFHAAAGRKALALARHQYRLRKPGSRRWGCIHTANPSQKRQRVLQYARQIIIRKGTGFSNRNMQIFTIQEINAYLRELLESERFLRDIWLEAEISNFNRHAGSGHCYFRLKGENAVLDAVMWRSHADRLAELPRNGDAVLIHGYISFYESGGRLQLYADAVLPAGIGLLHAQLEALAQRLAAEGLFALERKRLLPPLPRRVGVVTSAQAAAFQDILHVLQLRCPLVEVVLAPCQVQGERAPDSIVTALHSIYAADVDIVILARGGGAIEDLWAFNDERVVRAAFAAPMPLISGIGHETDFTLVDDVADLRAATPSAAAAAAVPDRPTMLAALAEARQRMEQAALAMLAERFDQIAAAAAQIERRNPTHRLAQARQQVDELQERSRRAVLHAHERRSLQLQSLAARLQTLDPHATLARGYALVQHKNGGSAVTSAHHVHPADELDILFQRGRLRTRVQHVEHDHSV